MHRRAAAEIVISIMAVVLTADRLSPLSAASEQNARTSDRRAMVVSVLTRTVDTHVAELRRKLEDDPSQPKYILTSRKAGYRLRQGEPA